MGVVGDTNWTKDIYGVTYHGAEYFNADGVKMVEVVGVENNPHWVSAAYPELAWEFHESFLAGGRRRADRRGVDGEAPVRQRVAMHD